MNNKKTTKRALVTSILSLVLCMSMLIGTTFAWFTDNVSSKNNIIKSGNLDVEMEYYDGDSWEKVTENTNVFEENTLWEPGHTEVVYLKVSNLGTLALKYNLGINIVNEIESINVAGEALRLSDHIEFGAIEGVKTPYADRAAARAAVTEAKTLSTGYTKAGNIEAGAEAQYVALVVYMPETVGNEANYRTGEVAPEITLGLNLMATQHTSEKDSFDNQYDANATFDGVPAARVTKLAKMPTVTTINNNEETLDVAYVFNTTETYDQAQQNAKSKWHADFVAYFDQDVDDAWVGLAGAYDTYQNGEWLAFELDGVGDLKANKPVRMLETANISMNYEELCLLVEKFSCGAFTVDGYETKMAGKTMTVELRIYETEEPSAANGNSTNVETGEYITIGTYSYTFPAIKAADNAGLQAALKSGAKYIELGAGEFELANLKKGVTIVGTKDTVVNKTLSGTLDDVTLKNIHIKAGNAQRWAYSHGTLVFEDCTFEATGTYAIHYDGLNGANITYKNCTIIGWAAIGGGAEHITFDECKIYGNGTYGLIRVYSPATVKNCTFDVAAVNTTDAYTDGLQAVGCEVKVSNNTNVNGTMEEISFAANGGSFVAE